MNVFEQIGEYMSFVCGYWNDDFNLVRGKRQVWDENNLTDAFADAIKTYLFWKHLRKRKCLGKKNGRK